ncbi:hypothetical protein [Helicobacter pylori]|uniref:hypothetical protein n=1 Tax=Helicobacter pylori TaxID=210 RepID=UPI000992A06D|nr:hypothetical protein [Helicobacter pylori]OOP88436.1 hypothetical protein B0X37_08125 [Helicobacter pylori]OOP89471.1 hypothetical protein B0X37_06635 [Helicobacter pylori]OOP89997.1 hypothetical protein B0X37_05975 [Helicobacter pylori]OOQ27629.1 hypothetical protein B0X57_04715 [Helicobacter pylori]WQW58920.1 hypothetical protein KVM31_04630 [Helicobacter pylori]
MQLLEKWESARDAYDTFTNAILKMFDSDSDRFSILVKSAESVEDYPLVFKFKNANNEVWKFIVRDKQDENKTMRDFLEESDPDSATHLLGKPIERARECLSLVKQYRENKRDCAVVIIDYLIVELLVNGGFNDYKKDSVK